MDGVDEHDINQIVTFEGLRWACNIDPEWSVVNMVFVCVDSVLLFCAPCVIIGYCYKKVIQRLNEVMRASVFAKRSSSRF